MTLLCIKMEYIWCVFAFCTTVSITGGSQATNAFHIVNTNQDAMVTFVEIIKALKQVLPGVQSIGMPTAANRSDTKLNVVQHNGFKTLIQLHTYKVSCGDAL